MTCSNVKLMEIFNDIPKVFGIADDILVIGYNKDGTDHDRAVYKVLKCCQDVNLKLNKDKCHFRCTSIPFFGGGCIKGWHAARSADDQCSDRNAGPKSKKEPQAFLGIINYLSKFSPDTSEVCEPLRKLTSSKAMWIWDATYQQRFEKAKSLIKVEMCMEFYDDSKPLYLETDASGVGPRAALLQLRD